MPKTEERPIMTIREFKVLNIGGNLNVTTPNPVPSNRQTTQDTSLIDQSIMDLGIAYNTGTNTDNTDTNKVKLQFTAYLNDHTNVTDGAKFWVGARVIARQKMVWVGQIEITAQVNETEPKPQVDMTYSNDT